MRKLEKLGEKQTSDSFSPLKVILENAIKKKVDFITPLYLIQDKSLLKIAYLQNKLLKLNDIGFYSKNRVDSKKTNFFLLAEQELKFSQLASHKSNINCLITRERLGNRKKNMKKKLKCVLYSFFTYFYHFLL